MSHVFISYSRQNRDYARKLADQLLASGFDVWIDDRIDYGEDWEFVIFDAIAGCAAFIILMSPSSYQSKWVRREVQYADKKNKPQFPILLEGEEFPRYGPTQFFNALDGALPDKEFIDELTGAAPRKQLTGEDIVLRKTSEIPALSPESEKLDPPSPASGLIVGDDPEPQDDAPDTKPEQGKSSLEVPPPANALPSKPADTASSSSVQSSRVPKRSILIIGSAVLAGLICIGLFLISNFTEEYQSNLNRTVQMAWGTTSLLISSLVPEPGSVTLSLTEIDPAECQNNISFERLLTPDATSSSYGNFTAVDFDGIYYQDGSRIIQVPHAVHARDSGDFLIFLWDSARGHTCFSGVLVPYVPHSHEIAPGAAYIYETVSVRSSPCLQESSIVFTSDPGLVTVYETSPSSAGCPSHEDGMQWYKLRYDYDYWVASSVADLVFLMDVLS